MIIYVARLFQTPYSAHRKEIRAVGYFKMSRLLKFSQASRLLAVDTSTVFRWVRDGKLGPVVGKPARIPLAAVQELGGHFTAEQIEKACRPHGNCKSKD
jgi:hypothetical protein